MFEKFSLEGKVAVVTGGGTGIGKAIALNMAKVGANIVVAARRLTPLEETKAEIEDIGRNAMAIQTDVTNSEQVNNLMEETASEFGRLDILVNSAGAIKEFFNISLLEMTDEQWRRGLDSELTGTFYCSRAAGKLLMKQHSGKIINMSSLSGMVGLTTTAVYGVAKAGIIELTKLFAMALARHGVQVNCIAGGPILTPTIGGQKESMSMGRFIPVGYPDKPEGIAALAVYLASEASSYVTGATYIIDGGIMAGRYAPLGYAPYIPMK